MTDEVESHHTEQLPICLWFVDKECNFREEFLEFGKCEQTNGKSVFKEIMRIVTALSFVVVKSTMEGLICLHKLLESKSELKISAKNLSTPIVTVTS